MLKNTLLMICFCILLSACAQPPRETPILSLDTRQKILTQLQTWNAAGKVAITEAKENNSASFEWQQKPQNYELFLFSPLASDSARIIGTAGQVTLTTNGQTYTAANADALIYEHLGWDLPFTNLTYWIRGLAAPGNAETTYDQRNQLQRLQQNGWLIEYQSYTNAGNISLPDKISLSKGDTKIKLIIRSWQS